MDTMALLLVDGASMVLNRRGHVARRGRGREERVYFSLDGGLLDEEILDPGVHGKGVRGQCHGGRCRFTKLKKVCVVGYQCRRCVWPW